MKTILRPRITPLCLALFLFGCAAGTRGVATEDAPLRVRPEQRAAAQASVTALQAGDFPAAQRTSDALLTADPKNPLARAVRAIVRYQAASQQLLKDAQTLLNAERSGVNHRFLRYSLEQAEQSLAAVEDDLAVAARDRDFALELCPACWSVDWNGNGRVDSRDRRLFEIEVGAKGEEIPEEDPRRKPTFRLDVGDVHWARAMVGFQRGLLNLALAYRYDELESALRSRGEVLRIVLTDPERVRRARALWLGALDQADRCRAAYLAETDDDREWVPSPRQQSHPMPLPVDDALYQTWGALTGDARRLLRGDDALPLRSLLDLIDERQSAKLPPNSAIALGVLFDRPRDLELSKETARLIDEDPGAGLQKVLGDAFLLSPRQLSSLPERLLRMKREISQGAEPLERKLRYLFWLN